MYKFISSFSSLKLCTPVFLLSSTGVGVMGAPGCAVNRFPIISELSYSKCVPFTMDSQPNNDSQGFFPIQVVMPDTRFVSTTPRDFLSKVPTSFIPLNIPLSKLSSRRQYLLRKGRMSNASASVDGRQVSFLSQDFSSFSFIQKRGIAVSLCKFLDNSINEGKLNLSFSLSFLTISVKTVSVFHLNSKYVLLPILNSDQKISCPFECFTPAISLYLDKDYDPILHSAVLIREQSFLLGLVLYTFFRGKNFLLDLASCARRPFIRDTSEFRVNYLFKNDGVKPSLFEKDYHNCEYLNSLFPKLWIGESRKINVKTLDYILVKLLHPDSSKRMPVSEALLRMSSAQD